MLRFGTVLTAPSPSARSARCHLSPKGEVLKHVAINIALALEGWRDEPQAHLDMPMAELARSA